jgi:hypothetical protein
MHAHNRRPCGDLDVVVDGLSASASTTTPIRRGDGRLGANARRILADVSGGAAVSFRLLGLAPLNDIGRLCGTYVSMENRGDRAARRGDQNVLVASGLGDPRSQVQRLARFRRQLFDLPPLLVEVAAVLISASKR